ncbi:MAG TPA: hypothetical protein VFS52_19620 [Steroidobacteraceae bacterium]|jgi:hypothetical protein|nr:hypothetical protein [Steroidobacteraceae bacterium]
MSESATPISAQGATGAICSQSGPYRSNRNARVIVFVAQGTVFPTDADGAATVWVLVSDTD